MIQDKHLENVAKAVNNETYTVVSYLARGTSTISVDATNTILDGEIGSRDTFTGSRTDNVVTFNGIISGANIQNTTDGDNLKGLGSFSANSDGEMHTEISLPGLLQTTAFDLDVDWVLTYDRA